MENARPIRPTTPPRDGRNGSMTGGTLSGSLMRPTTFASTEKILRSLKCRVNSRMLGKNARQGVWEENQTGADQPAPRTAKLKISPGSHSARTSNGRQHTSQSVVNRCVRVLVSITSSKVWPQYGH